VHSIFIGWIVAQAVMAALAARRGVSNLAAFFVANAVSPMLGALVAIAGPKRKAGARWGDFVLWDFLKPLGMVAVVCFGMLAGVMVLALALTGWRT
jgi:hypothetical protein